MITLIIALSFLGFYSLYNGTQKVDLRRSLLIEIWLQDNPMAAKAVGLSLNFVALIASTLYYGAGSGIFLYFVVLMTVGSLVVLIAPLRFVDYKMVATVFIFSLFIEII